jgi:hypothetical protein
VRQCSPPGAAHWALAALPWRADGRLWAQRPPARSRVGGHGVKDRQEHPGPCHEARYPVANAVGVLPEVGRRDRLEGVPPRPLRGRATIRRRVDRIPDRGSAPAGLGVRHAHLAVYTAITYCKIILDTLGDPNAPWRKDAIAAVAGNLTYQRRPRRTPARPPSAMSSMVTSMTRRRMLWIVLVHWLVRELRFMLPDVGVSVSDTLN